ncbi:MAG: DNA lyase [Ignavibacteriae bacterium]|nr:DNA lyase [Ignavibacteriota bacterium]
MKPKRYKDIEQVHRDHAERGERARERLREFARVPPTEYFYELAYCLLTPQSSAVNADTAVARLKELSFFERGGDPTPVLRQRDAYIRFHNTKARRLLTVREQFPVIAARLAATPHGTPTGAPTEEVLALRDWMIAHVNGLGRKEAAHFLRNIGYRGLAILDRHILRNLTYHGVLRTMPTSLTPARYSIIEGLVRQFAADTGIDMDELDLLFWSRETGEIRK